MQSLKLLPLKFVVILGVLTLFSLAWLQLLAPSAAHASTSYSWTGKDQGVNESWTDPGNWNPIGVPGSGDDVTIASPTPDVTFAQVTLGTSISLNSLTLEGSSSLSGGSLTVGSFDWTGDSSLGRSFLQTSVTVAGTATINGVGPKVIQTPDGSTTPTLTLQGNTSLSGPVLQTNGGKIVNTGTFTAQPGSTITDWSCCVNLDQFVNQGSVLVPSSSLGMQSVIINGLAFNDSGSVSIGSNSTLELQLAPSPFASGVSFSGGGILLIDDTATVQLSGTVNLGSGTTFQIGLDNQFHYPGTLTGTGTLSGSGGTFSWNGGTIMGNLTVASSISTMISGNDQKLIQSPDGSTTPTFTLQGNTALSGTGLQTDMGKIVNTGTFTAQPGSTITGQNCCVNPDQFVNQGTFIVNVGAGLTASISEIAFNNSGTVDLKSGTFQFGDPGYTQTAGSTLLQGGALASTSSAIVTLQGGRLGGKGTITASVHNGALIDPGASIPGEGLIKIVGNYTQTSTGTLRADIKSAGTPGVAYDQLSVSGTATLSGMLDIMTASGFIPKLTNQFIVVQAKTRTGMFKTLLNYKLPNSLEYYAQYTTTSAILKVKKV